MVTLSHNLNIHIFSEERNYVSVYWTIFASEDTDSRFVSKLDALLLEKSDREILTLRGNGEIVLQSVRCTLEPKGGSLGFDVAKTQRV